MQKRSSQRCQFLFLVILTALFFSILLPPNLRSVLLENADLVELNENPVEEEQTEKSEIDDFLFDAYSEELASQKAHISHLCLFSNWSKPIVEIDLPPPESFSRL